MKAAQISAIINEVKDGVERSNLGHLVDRDQKDQACFDQIALQTFYVVLNSLLPNNSATKVTYNDDE